MNAINGCDQDQQDQHHHHRNQISMDIGQQDIGDNDGHHLAPFLSINWSNVSVTIQAYARNLCSIFNGPKVIDQKKIILHSQTGSLLSGDFLAIIGPSGAGKTTLLECLAGRKKNAQGKVWIASKQLNRKELNQIKVAIIDQKDALIQDLNAYESLMFASRIKNHQAEKSVNHHHQLVHEILGHLNLNQCSNTLAKHLSGGQKKRLSIALELISKPNILILDEPTSGLDSTSALQCLQLLRGLTEAKPNPVTVIASIHQPSSKFLSTFHKLYVLSHDGRCIFNDHVANLLPSFSNFGLECPKFHNPSDFAIDIASGDSGYEAIELLANAQLKFNEFTLPSDAFRSADHRKSSRKSLDIESENLMNTQLNDEPIVKMSSLVDKMSNANYPFFLHFGLLFKRSMIITLRNPMLTLLTIGAHLFIAFLISILYNPNIGNTNGCYSSKISSNISVFDILKFQEQGAQVQQNLAFFFFSIMFILLTSMMPTVLTFPLEMSVLISERSNGWYSFTTYFLARTLIDVPFTVICAIFYAMITYYMTGQIESWDRFLIIMVVFIICSFVGQSYGLLIGAIWVHDLSSAVFAAPVSSLPVILLSGFFVHVQAMPSWIKPVTWISYLKYAYEIIIITIYGFGRCDLNQLTSLELSSNSSLVPSSAFKSCDTLFKLQNLLSKLNISLTEMMPLIEFEVRGKNLSMEPVQEILKDLQILNGTNNLNVFSPGNLDISGSFIMSLFNLNDDDIWLNFWLLLAAMFFIRILSYFILLFKANKHI